MISPNITDSIGEHLAGMRIGTIGNYILPGLQSAMLGETERGKIRMFTATRPQEAHITPHSHRFDLACYVVKGWVENCLYRQSGMKADWNDEFMVSRLTYGGEPGKYAKEQIGTNLFAGVSSRWEEGQWYFMQADEIHSIVFGKGTSVLIFEGATKTDESVILEPVVDGKVVPTFGVQDWMFKA